MTHSKGGLPLLSRVTALSSPSQAPACGHAFARRYTLPARLTHTHTPKSAPSSGAQPQRPLFHATPQHGSSANAWGVYDYRQWRQDSSTWFVFRPASVSHLANGLLAVQGSRPPTGPSWSPLRTGPVLTARQFPFYRWKNERGGLSYSGSPEWSTRTPEGPRAPVHAPSRCVLNTQCGAALR